jgi:hypothetical protein
VTHPTCPTADVKSTLWHPSILYCTDGHKAALYNSDSWGGQLAGCPDDNLKNHPGPAPQAVAVAEAAAAAA